MLIRRCTHLHLEPDQGLTLDVASLFSGNMGLQPSAHWCAHAPHLAEAVTLQMADMAVLGRLSASLWIEHRRIEEPDLSARLDALLATGLVIGDAEEHLAHRQADERVAQLAWFGPSAHLHQRSRWQGIDSRRDDARRNGSTSFQKMEDTYGAIPAHFHSRVEASDRVHLPPAKTGSIEALLRRRSSCRNFAPQALLSLEQLSRALKAVFGAHGTRELASHSFAVKKFSPSGGALHPIEAYLVVQRISGLAPGLYHYHVGEHALESLTPLDADAAYALALVGVAGQEWFAEAPVQIVLAARFHRNYWKYRNHPKAYRVIQLDAGHLSQNLFLIATEMGLGAFITAAVNEVELDQALGLDGISEGTLCVIGLGERAAERVTVEFDADQVG